MNDSRRKSRIFTPGRALPSFDASVMITKRKTTIKDIGLQGTSLFLFGPRNPLRKISTMIVFHPKFDPFILFMIIFSTILLTLENPLDDPNGEKMQILFYIDIVVTTIFTLECAFKNIV